ncbi:uncharacterized protein G2W53_004593 [Senna tora]|uniref:Uncharacterized protein n=1 Tax=Senna tora TaxID=362788 RepID=A0A835CJH9_9FABA|nr:uncharacterized protein G2W53_004593 [Senna tora]
MEIIDVRSGILSTKPEPNEDLIPIKI